MPALTDVFYHRQVYSKLREFNLANTDFFTTLKKTQRYSYNR